jgi:hypothetical protein
LWACAGYRSYYKPIWYDEAVTVYIARSPSVASLMNAIYDGTDQNLPLSHLAVRLSYAVFGYSELTTRLPALFGFWVMLLCLFLFLKKRLPLPCAFAGTIFPMLTLAWQYSYEARSYGLLLGAGSLALYCWQSGTDREDRRRYGALAGISMSLAMALSAHVYGLLLAIPFTAGEIARSIQRKRIDVPVWVAFLIPAPLVLFYPGLLAVARSWDFSGMQPNMNALAGFFPDVFRTAITPIVFAGLAAALFSAHRNKDNELAEGLRLYELIALGGFLLGPWLFFLAGSMLHTTIAYVPRYGLLSVVGASGLMSWTLAKIMRDRMRSAAVFAAVLAFWLVAARTREALSDRRPPAEQITSVYSTLVDALKEGLPVMVAQPHIFLQADYYLPAQLLDRAYYVADPETEHNYLSQELVDQITIRVARNFPLRSHVVYWNDFRHNRRFLLHTGKGYDQWAYDRLIREGWRVTVRAHTPDQAVYEVNAPATGTP